MTNQQTVKAGVTKFQDYWRLSIYGTTISMRLSSPADALGAFAKLFQSGDGAYEFPLLELGHYDGVEINYSLTQDPLQASTSDPATARVEKWSEGYELHINGYVTHFDELEELPEAALDHLDPTPASLSVFYSKEVVQELT